MLGKIMTRWTDKITLTALCLCVASFYQYSMFGCNMYDHACMRHLARTHRSYSLSDMQHHNLTALFLLFQIDMFDAVTSGSIWYDDWCCMQDDTCMIWYIMYHTHWLAEQWQWTWTCCKKQVNKLYSWYSTTNVHADNMLVTWSTMTCSKVCTSMA